MSAQTAYQLDINALCEMPHEQALQTIQTHFQICAPVYLSTQDSENYIAMMLNAFHDGLTARLHDIEHTLQYMYAMRTRETVSDYATQRI